MLALEQEVDIPAAPEHRGMLAHVRRAVRERLSEHSLKLLLSDESKKYLIKKGSNLDFGARPLRRAIENYVEDPLSEELLKGEFQGKDTITVGVKEVGGKKQLVFEGSVTEPVEEAPAVAAAPTAGLGLAEDAAGALDEELQGLLHGLGDEIQCGHHCASMRS